MSKEQPHPDLFVLGTTPAGKPLLGNTGFLLKHTLVVGDRESGKSRYLAHLHREHRKLGYPSAIFDSQGTLYNLAMDLAAKSAEPNVVPVDTSDPEWVTLCSPLQGRHIADPGTGKILQELVLEGSARSRERIPPLDPNWQSDKEVFRYFSNLFAENSYFRCSVLGRGKQLKFEDHILDGRNIFVKNPRSPGSVIYGLLLFQNFMRLALTCRPPLPYLVFVDQGYSFISDYLTKEVFKELTKRQFGLVLSFSYPGLGLLKRHNNELYRTVLDNCSVSSLAASTAEEDILDDVVAHIGLDD